MVTLILLYILPIIVSYLIGSFPTAYLLGRIFYKKDIRHHGSGNSGATNALRVFGFWPAMIVLIFDILKGYIATGLLGQDCVQIFLGVSVILGHIFPIFAGFRGGKAVATTFGCFIAINPILIVIPLIVWIGVFYMSRMSSLSSLSAILSLTFSAVIFNTESIVTVFILFCCMIISYTHKENIHKLIKGEEKKLF